MKKNIILGISLLAFAALSACSGGGAAPQTVGVKVSVQPDSCGDFETIDNGIYIEWEITNNSSRAVEVSWISYEGNREDEFIVNPGETLPGHEEIYAGHSNCVRDAETGEFLLGFTHVEGVDHYTIEEIDLLKTAPVSAASCGELVTADLGGEHEWAVYNLSSRTVNVSWVNQDGSTQDPFTLAAGESMAELVSNAGHSYCVTDADSGDFLTGFTLTNYQNAIVLKDK